jgi:hypothetical protein
MFTAILFVFVAAAQPSAVEPMTVNQAGQNSQREGNVADTIVSVLTGLKPRFRFEILDAQIEKDRIILYGILESAEQRDAFEVNAEDELKESKDFDVPGKQQMKVDVSKMYVVPGKRMSDMAKLLLVEKFFDDTLSEFVERTTASNLTVGELVIRGKIRVLHYEPLIGRITLCGVVPDNYELDRVKRALLRLNGVTAVVTDHVLLSDARRPSNDATDVYFDTLPLFSEAMSALKRRSGRELVCLTDEMIRMGRFVPTVWYLRAAGHLMEGDSYLARGDVRLGNAEGNRHGLLQNFQGHLRIQLEKMVAHGPFISTNTVELPCPSRSASTAADANSCTPSVISLSSTGTLKTLQHD